MSTATSSQAVSESQESLVTSALEVDNGSDMDEFDDEAPFDIVDDPVQPALFYARCRRCDG